MSIASLEKKLAALSKSRAKRVKIDWTANAGTQALAYHHPASELLFGGSAGGGKTFLLIGLSLTAHRRSLIVARELSRLSAAEAEFEKLTGLQFNARTHLLKVNNRLIELGGCKLVKNMTRWKGRDHDLKGFDELTEFTEEQYEFIRAWNRTSIKGQRCRTVATSNAPDDIAGKWIVRHWAPWLDKKHPRSAVSGEIRYFLGGEECDENTPNAESRSFIRSAIDDNPILLATGYKQKLEALPPELRSRLLLGEFDAEFGDQPYQVCPSAAIATAKNRQHLIDKSAPLTAIGVDCARGGKARTVFALLYADGRVEVKIYPGSDTPDGAAVVRLLLPLITAAVPIFVDSIGIGSAVCDALKIAGIPHTPVNVSMPSYRRDRTGLLSFANLRAELQWGLREALESRLIIPDNAQIEIDLSAARYTYSAKGILIESKEAIGKRLGFSPDIADAIALAIQKPRVYESGFS